MKPYKQRRSDNQAFTLVELSIVLVILGLLTGGILTGQSLIRAAELRSVVTEVQRYQTAVQSFRDKYMAIPGDMKTATQFWGDDNTNCADAAVTNGTPGTCNGNGNGTINGAAGAGLTGEVFQAWKQMALAGLIEGSYTGIAGAAFVEDAVLGVNVPASKLSNGGWWIQFLGTQAGDTVMYGMSYGTVLIFGSKQGAAGKPEYYILRPEEAWNIDMKVDDGLPARGKIIARFWDDVCAVADDGTPANNDLNASYNLTNSAVVCSLYVRQLF